MAEQRQAAQIPNLLSLRGSRTSRGRGRGHGSPNLRSPEESREVTESVKDKIVQQTDQDASDSRMSAVSLGYLEDDFAAAFSNGPVNRRYPIINRGTYARTTAIDRLVDKFLSTYPKEPKQIISLGAGSDTRYFRLVTSHPDIQLLYHELDFADNTRSKINTIKNSPLLLKTISSHTDVDSIQISADGTTLTSPTYNIHALDLRDLAKDENIPNLPNLSKTTPTLLLSECCLIYLPPSSTIFILRTLTQTLLPQPTPLSLILYEPINPHDAFGQVMIQNLLQRGIHLQTLHAYSSLSLQKQRLKDAGFTGGQEAADVDFIYERWIGKGERDRVGRCEFLDEIEEWRLLARHYCVAWGWRDGVGGEGGVFGKAWGDVEGQDDGGGG
ncbi:leucine carboxyl methyltransferase [Tothia fuscella]|uniref:Leucine carboxyl methyltransferase 1 n=1 Tax=Tothia fuscella TaxID=1048955 RepID=A0A9P4U4P1_9PEZI|nr:leucine carboxyl methyltransferase [Tothia fuscella]